MPTVSKLRRTYFALIKELLPGDLDRHDFQARLTGKESTRRWTRADWLKAIAWLQRQGGQHEDQTAHVREDRPHGVAREAGTLATRAQCRLIEELCETIDWRVGRDAGTSREARRAYGPVAYVCRHFLGADRHADLRETIKTRHLAHPDDPAGQWRMLPRHMAGDLIQALQRMAQAYPYREEAT